MSGRSPKRAFVTGSTGGIGSVLCERLSSEGWIVTAVTRPMSDAASIAGLERVTIVHCDLFDEDALAAAMHGCDAVFHLAAQVHAPDTEPRSSFDKVNVEATRHVVNAAAAAGVQSFVFFSTVAVFPESDELFDESSAVNPSTPYGATKLAGEAIVLEKKQAMRVTILRLPVVYGPRDRGNVRRLIDAIARGRFVIPGTGDNVKTMVAAGNVAHAAMRASLDQRASGKIFIVADEQASTLAEIVAAISSALNMRRSPRRVPVGILKAAALVADGLRRATGLNLPITSDQVAKLAANTRYSGERIRRELDLQYPVRLEDGMIAAIAGYRDALPGASARPWRRT